MGDAGNAVNAVLSDAGNKANETLSETEKKGRKALSGTAGLTAVAGEIGFDTLTGGNRGAAREELDRLDPSKKAEAAAGKAEEEQTKVEEELKKNEEIADNTANVKKERTRQKKLAARKTGRSSTILTSPIGAAPSGDQAPLKTLLGS